MITVPASQVASELALGPRAVGSVGSLGATMRCFLLVTLIALCSCSPSPHAVNKDEIDVAIAKANYPAARTLLGKPDARFMKAKQNFQLGMRHAATSSLGQTSRDAVESIFTDEVLRIIIVLDKTGDRKQA